MKNGDYLTIILGVLIMIVGIYAGLSSKVISEPLDTSGAVQLCGLLIIIIGLK